MKRMTIFFLSCVLLLPSFALASRHSLHKSHSRLSQPRLLLRTIQGISLAKTGSSTSTAVRMIQDSSVVYDSSSKAYVPGELITVNYSQSGHLVSLVQIVADDSIAQNIYGSTWKTMYYADLAGNIDSLVDLSYGDNGWANSDMVHISPGISDALLSIDGPQGTGMGLFCNSGEVYFHLSSLDGDYWDIAAQTWAKSGRDTITLAARDTAVRVDQQWDPASASYQTVYSDSFFKAGSNIATAIETNFSDSMRYVCSGTYDAAGDEIEESQTSLFWNADSSKWSFSSKIRYVQAFDSNQALQNCVVQDSSNGVWTPLDSCSKIVYRYSRDSSGAIVSRTDSTWYSGGDIVREIHYFKYGAFSTGTLFGQAARPSVCPRARIFGNGMVKTTAPVSISICDLCGKIICTLRADSQMSLWGWCAGHGIRVGKGVYAARIRETNASFMVVRQ